MGWNVKANSGGGNFEACPAGNHAAVLVALIDLGTQENDYQGNVTKARKIFFVWEVPGEQTSDGSNHFLGKSYTFSLNEKAAMRKMIESWRTKPLAEGEEFDISVLIGKPCMLTVLNETKKDKTYSKISGISSVPKGMPIPKATASPIMFNIDDDPLSKFPDFDWIPRDYGSKLVDIAALSPEWQAKSGGAQASQANQATTRGAGSNGQTSMAAAPSQDADTAPF